MQSNTIGVDDDDTYDIDSGVISLEYGESTSDYVDPFNIDVDEVKNLSGISPNKKRSLTAMQKRFEGREGIESKRLEDMVITGYNAFMVVLPPYNLDYLAKLYELSAPHKAAVDAKMSNIVSLGYDFVYSPTAKKAINAIDDETKAAKKQQKLEDAKNELLDYLDELNDEDTFQEILQKVWKDYETTGNGYMEIGRDVNGNIALLSHIPSTTMRVRRVRDGFVQIVANRAVYFRNFGQKDPDPFGNDQNPNEVIHIKKYAPSSTFYGIPDIVAAKQAVAGNEFSARFNLDYFENKAVPRHVIILKGATMNPRLAKNILEFFETGLKGKNHRSLFIPLPGDSKDKKVELTIEAVEAGVQDASFNNYRKANLQEILMAHRVPITKVSVSDGIALAAAKDADKTFKEQVCQPEQKIFEKKLNRIVKSMTDLFLLKLNELALTDENTQSQIDERRRKTGIETANEQRQRRGDPHIEGGDELFDMNAATKLGQMNDETVRRGQDITGTTAGTTASTPKAGANNNGNPVGTKQRDSARASASTDGVGGGRNPKGDGRTNNVT